LSVILTTLGCGRKCSSGLYVHTKTNLYVTMHRLGLIRPTGSATLFRIAYAHLSTLAWLTGALIPVMVNSSLLASSEYNRHHEVRPLQ